MKDRIKYICNEFNFKKLIKNKKIILMCSLLIVIALFITIKTFVDKPKADISDLPTVLTTGSNTLKDGTVIRIEPAAYKDSSNKEVMSYRVLPDGFNADNIAKFKTITYGVGGLDGDLFKSSIPEERKIKEYQKAVLNLTKKTSNSQILDQVEKVKNNRYETRYNELWIKFSDSNKNKLLSIATQNSASSLSDSNPTFTVIVNSNPMLALMYSGNIYIFPFSKNEGSGSTTESSNSDGNYGRIKLNEKNGYNFAVEGTQYLYYEFNTFTHSTNFYYDPARTIPCHKNDTILVPFVDGYAKKFNGASISFGENGREKGTITFDNLGQIKTYEGVSPSDLTHINNFSVDYTDVPYNVTISFKGVGDQSLTPGSTFTTLPEIPDKTGSKGTSWNLNGRDIQVGVTKVPYINSTATPVYKKQTAVTLDARGGTIGLPQSLNPVLNSPYTIYYDAGSIFNTPLMGKKDGYTFEGWYTSISGGEKVTSETLIPSSDVTYYAHYKYNGSEDKNVSITFNGNGGKASLNGMTRDNVSVGLTAGSTITNLPTGEREGYTLEGWYTQANGGNKITASTTVPDSDTTYYAHWTKDSSSSGGSSGGSTTPTITINLGGNGNNTTIKANADGTIPKPADPKKDGYKFDGWYKNKNYTEKWDFSKDKVTSDTTLYAKWTKDTVDEKDEYFVTFNSNGGSKVNSQKVLLGNKITKPTDPSKANDKFMGWYKDSKFTTLWDFDKDVVNGDTTLYAKWSTTVVDPNKNESSITFETTDGSDISGITVKNDNKITKPADPKKDGYKFEGWYKDSNYTEKWDFDKDTVTKDTTLYAKWSKIGTSESGKDIELGNPGSNDSVVNNPKTGDLNMSLILGIMGIVSILMIGSAVYIIISKKNENKKS